MTATVKKLAAIATAAFTIPLFASYPSVSSTSTAPNTWTSNIDGVLAAAKTTGYPILIIGVNGNNSGESCVHCERLFTYTINTTTFQETIKDTKFYMVLINFMPGGPGYRADAYSIYTRFNGPATYPLCSVLDSSGSVVAALNYTQTDYARIGSKTTAEYLREKLRALSRTVTELAFSAATGTAAAGGTYNGSVVRSGGEGTSVKVALALSGANAAKYTLSPAELDFGKADGTKNFTVSGPSDSSERIVADTVTVTLSATGYKEVEYRQKTIKLAFKDARILMTLSEYAAANSMFSSLSGSGTTWYVPKSAPSTIATGPLSAGSSATLSWTPPTDGTLKASGRSTGSGTIRIVTGQGEYPLGAAVSEIDVKAKETVRFVCQAGDGESGETFSIGNLAFTSTGAPYYAKTATSCTVYTKASVSINVAPDGAAPFEFSATKLPSGLSLNKSTGVISGTPKQVKTTKVTVTAKNAFGTAKTEVTIAVKNFADSGLKAKCAGIVFDAKENPIGTAELSIMTSASGTARFTLAGGKTSLKGAVTVDETGTVKFQSADKKMVLVRTGGLWAGLWSGRKVIATSGGGVTDGYYTAGLYDANDTERGYLTATFKSNGKVTTKLRVDGGLRVAMMNQALFLSAAQIAANLPSWSIGRNAVFFVAGKSVSGHSVAAGGAAYASGKMAVRVLVDGSIRNGAGAKFAQPLDLLKLAGRSLYTSSGTLIAPIAASATKASAGRNDFSAKLSVNKKTGIFTGNYTVNRARRQFEGVLIQVDGGIFGAGVTKSGAIEGVAIE